MGDGALVEFGSAVDAVTCAVVIQKGMADRNASTQERGRIEFRIGINLGEIVSEGTDIFGDGVNVAARLEGQAPRGGVLISDLVNAQVKGKIDATFVDAGEVRLKNVDQPIRVWRWEEVEAAAGMVVEENNLQVPVSARRKLLGPQPIRTVPGRGYRFIAAVNGPPTAESSVPVQVAREKTVSSVATAARLSNLPTELPPLHGREEDLQALRRLVDAHRLVTIVGTGGIGKTHLARAFAHAELGCYDDGIWWVDLTAVTDAPSLVSAIGATLGVGSQLGDNARSKVIQSLRARCALIVMDNCEILVDAVADLVGDALPIAANVHWLITSQQPLKLPDEQIYRLGPLSVPTRPTSAKDALEFGAVALLAQRISAADRRFSITDDNVEAATDLCAKLDGIPLAIEMAAARVPTLGLDRVRSLLGERLRLLASGHRTTLARHQTLHAALDWSHSLLTAIERTVLRRLGVFAGGFTLELAQDVVAGAGRYPTGATIDEWEAVEALEHLIEKSMVQAVLPPDAGEPRYSLLDTTRLYALERLVEARETEAAYACHAQSMAKFAERAFDEHWTQPDSVCIACMKPEIDNLRSALRWAVAHADADSAASIVGNAWPLFRMIDRQYESQAWMNMAEPLIRQATATRAARALAAIVYVFSGHRGGPHGIEAAREAVRRYRELNDQRGLYLALCALAFAGSRFSDAGSDADRDARAALAELDRLERPEWPARLRCWATVARAYTLRDDINGRLAPLREMNELAQSVGATERALTAQVNMLAALSSLGRTDETIDLARNIIDGSSLAGERLGSVLLILSEALVKSNRTTESREYARRGLHAWRQCNGACEAFAALASIALAERRTEDAARIAGYAESIVAREGIEREAQLLAIEEITRGIDAHMAVVARKKLMDDGARLAESQATSLALRIGTSHEPRA